MLKRALLIVPLILLLAAALLYSQHRSASVKVSGFVEANEIRVGSRVGGRVREVNAVEGKTLQAGDVLLQLEPFDLLEQQAQARANLAAAQAEYEKLAAGFRPQEIAQAKAHRDQLQARLEELLAGPRKEDIAAAQAQVELAEAQLNLAQLTFNRISAAFQRNAASQDELDRASSELRVAQARLSATRQELAKLRTGTRPEQIAQAKAQLEEADQALRLRQEGYRKEEIAQARAAVDAAQAALDAINKRLEELKVRSPADGVVEAVELQPGDLLAPNAPAISLIDTSGLWVRAYVPENVPVELGRRLRVTVDAYPGRFFRGHVSFIARQAEFTPSNVQTVEERSKQVFRIKVTLDEGLDLLRPGMIADVWLAPEPQS